ncbi:uncharacterized protein MONBRDRAFT_23600 [Monosiga brevicollis MX1]|uniref:Uncharacterized protein n=1 Tax=Monosiga brevicollis TaxID=81824 RepID=A9UTX3_MONBE|nr:uncharacterized protein MONBRDRAFT_23600 [Monosiga brevicollis MX1]EDQ91568.1 predicted protein [Monosiga brevicollis MX1]|eukprot:XP_001743990.1 hypothetical protein [Monosiga brevicollis MX1]
MPTINIIDMASPPASRSISRTTNLDDEMPIESGGHASCINGAYALLPDTLHDERPVFRHLDPIPDGFSEESGKHLFVVYHRDNDAWAISTELGSLDVLAYVMNDVLDSTAHIFDNATWYVSNGEGSYDADPEVQMSGVMVPRREHELMHATHDIDLPQQAADEVEEDDETEISVDLDHEQLETSPGVRDIPNQPREPMHPQSLKASTLHSRSRASALDNDGSLTPEFSEDELLDIAEDDADEDDGQDDGDGDGAVFAEAPPNARGRLKQNSTSLPIQPALQHLAEETSTDPYPESPQRRMPDISTGTRRGFAGLFRRDRTASAREKVASNRSRSASVPSRPTRSYSSSSTSADSRRRRGSISHMAKKVLGKLPGSQSARRVYQETKSKVLRMSGRLSPAEVINKCLARLGANPSAGEAQSLFADIQRALGRGRNPRDEVLVLRRNILDAWRVSLKQLTNPGTSDATLLIQILDFSFIKCSNVISEESLLLFCAKVLAINYLVVPGLSEVIVRAVSRATPIAGRRSFKIGQSVNNRCKEQQRMLCAVLPAEQRLIFYNIFQLSRMDLGNANDQCPATIPRTKFHHQFAKLFTSDDFLQTLEGFQTTTSPKLRHPNLWDKHVAVPGRWTARFVTRTDAGFGFLSVFLEVLVRRARSLYTFSYYATKADSLMGVNMQTTSAVALMPGFAELATCFLRLALTTQLAVKKSFPIGHGPPSLIVNWTERTAAAALALSSSGIFLSCLLEDLMQQTSLFHVPDVISLFESYEKVHNARLPADFDTDLAVDFVTRLLDCPHYVITMFTLRWLYENLDFFSDQQRTALTGLLTEDRMFWRLLGHWESGVRHLTITLLCYRLFRLRHVRVITSVLNALGCPPYSRTTIQTDHRSSPFARLYIVALLEQTRNVVSDARRWMRQQYGSNEDAVSFPPLALSLPPMNNMTSMYGPSKQSRK